ATDADPRQAVGPRIRVAEVAPGDCAGKQRTVGHAAGDNPDGIKVICHNFHAKAWNAAAMLEADHAAEGGRTDDAAGSLGSESQRNETVRDAGSGAAARAARRVPSVVRVRSRARLSGGELGGHRLAERDTAGRPSPGDAGGVRTGTMA